MPTKKRKTPKSSKPTVKKQKVKKISKQPIQNGAMAIIPYSEIIAPIVHQGKFSILHSYFPDKAIQFITQPTPPQYISRREGPGNKMFDYVDGHYAKKCANYVFGFSGHSIEIKRLWIEGLSVMCHGRMIVKDPKTGREVMYKEDVGSHTIRFLSGKPKTPENAVDIGNDYKAAVTDAQKRCMVQIGFFSDVYGKHEAKESGVIVVENGGAQQQPQKPRPPVRTQTASQKPQTKVQTQPATNGTDYLWKLKKWAYDLGAKTEAQALTLISKASKLNLKTLKITQNHAQMVIAAIARNQVKG